MIGHVCDGSEQCIHSNSVVRRNILPSMTWKGERMVAKVWRTKIIVVTPPKEGKWMKGDKLDNLSFPCHSFHDSSFTYIEKKNFSCHHHFPFLISFFHCYPFKLNWLLCYKVSCYSKGFVVKGISPWGNTMYLSWQTMVIGIESWLVENKNNSVRTYVDRCSTAIRRQTCIKGDLERVGHVKVEKVERIMSEKWIALYILKRIITYPCGDTQRYWSRRGSTVVDVCALK